MQQTLLFRLKVLFQKITHGGECLDWQSCQVMLGVSMDGLKNTFVFLLGSMSDMEIYRQVGQRPRLEFGRIGGNIGSEILCHFWPQ